MSVMPRGVVLALALGACGGSTAAPPREPVAPDAPQSSAAGESAEAAEAAEAFRAHAASESLAFKELESENRSTVSLQAGLTDDDRTRYIDENLTAQACSDAIVRAQWHQDISEFRNPAAHFDNCQVDGGLALLRSEYAAARREAQAGKVFLALGHLGRALHSVEDFYAHTNFVELATERGVAFENVPLLTLWNASEQALAPFRANLVSGTVFWEPGQCPAGVPSHKAMNKDGPNSERGSAYLAPWKRSHYRAVAELTKSTCSRLMRELLQTPEFSSVIEHCGKTYGFSFSFDQRKH